LTLTREKAKELRLCWRCNSFFGRTEIKCHAYSEGPDHCLFSEEEAREVLLRPERKFKVEKDGR